MSVTHPSSRRGFTLVEILIVVVILGILASIVIPQFTNASTEARRESMLTQLKQLRSQIEIYKHQHGGELPDLISDWTPLTDPSTYGGKTVGPYLQKKPKNSFNGLSDVLDGDGSVPLALCGYVYDYAGGTGTGAIFATDDSGMMIYEEPAP